MYKIKLTWSNVYSIIIALIPILANYRDPLDIAECGSILLVLFIPVLIIKGIGKKNTSLKKGYFFLVLFLIDVAASIFIWGNYDAVEYRKAVLTFLIMAFCLLFHLYFGVGNLFKLNIALKTVQIVSIINSFFIMCQYIFHYLFHSYINIVISPMLVEAAQHYQTYLSTGLTNGAFRPAGFFLEPSHFSLYSIVAITSLVIPDNMENRRIHKIIIIVLGIALTTSGIGIFITLLISIIGLFNEKHISIKTIIKVYCGVIGLAIIILVLFQFNFFQSAVSRVFTGNIKTSAIYSRIYNMLFFFKAPSNIQVYGNGFMTFPESYYPYFNGAIKLLYGQGYIGACILLLFLFTRFRYSIKSGKVLIGCFIGLFLIAEMYSTVYLLFYLMFICSMNSYISNISNVNANIVNLRTAGKEFH